MRQVQGSLRLRSGQALRVVAFGVVWLAGLRWWVSAQVNFPTLNFAKNAKFRIGHPIPSRCRRVHRSFAWWLSAALGLAGLRMTGLLRAKLRVSAQANSPIHPVAM